MLNFLFPDMRDRSYEPELMDSPIADEKKLLTTVAQFKVINRLFSRSQALIARYIIADMSKDPSREYTFLDIGAGGCDIAVWLAKKCQKKGLTIKITCLDYDERIVAFAKEQCKFLPNIHVLQGSAFALDSYDSFDYVFTNHFLHHLTYKENRRVLHSISNATKRIFLLNDLRRSTLGYLGYTLFTGLFLYNSFAFYDGRLSILRGFLAEEYQREVLDRIQTKDTISIGSCTPSRLFILGTK